MIYRIHYTTPSGRKTFISAEGDNEAELIEAALTKIAKRKGTDPWIEEITALCEPPRSWKRH